MKPHSWSGRIKLWLLMNDWVEGAIGIALAIGFFGLIFLGVALVMKPGGPAVESRATIIAIGATATETGNMPRATIRLDDGSTGTVRLLRSHHCQIGDTVTVETTPGVGHEIVHGDCQA